jgi:D-alanyl-lipoteichoic acid acyltransferase DltB (MBOAT superfamily)
VLVRPLAAPSLAEFWRTWNPVWSYYLAAWCYRPVRRVLPHAAAVMVTFTASGHAHNLLAALLSHGWATPRAGANWTCCGRWSS